MGPKKVISKDEASKKRKSEGNISDPQSKKIKEDVTDSKSIMNEKLPLDQIDYSCSKKSASGEEPNFKIASWNVAGLRACVKKECLEYIKKENADIFCLQETKCEESKLPPEVKNRFPEYHTYWLGGLKAGYAGVGLYTKKKPLKVSYGIGSAEFDSEGRLITAEYENFYLVAVYVPNAGQGLKTLDKRMKWDKLFHEHLAKLDQIKPVILVGDLNVAHHPIDLANPASNTRSAGFTVEERDSFSSLLERGFVDSFRKLYPDKTGAYTYWTYMNKAARSRNTGWRIDYYVVSERLMENVCDNLIRNNIYGSDHCPIVLYLKV